MTPEEAKTRAKKEASEESWLSSDGKKAMEKSLTRSYLLHDRFERWLIDQQSIASQLLLVANLGTETDLVNDHLKTLGMLRRIWEARRAVPIQGPVVDVWDIEKAIEAELGEQP